MTRSLIALTVAAMLPLGAGLATAAAPTAVLDPDSDSPGVPLDWTTEDGSLVGEGEWADIAGPDEIAPGPLARVTGAGFTTFDDVVSNSDVYTVNLVGDARIEQVRGVVNAAVNEINSKSGGVVRLTVGASLQASHSAVQNEITIYLDDTVQPCGNRAWGEWIGCAGPKTWYRSDGTLVAGAGRVFFPTRFLNASDQLGTMTHDLVHALGLTHYDGVYQGTTQLMHPSRTVSTLQQGDINGIQYLASNRGVHGNLERATGAAKAIIVGGWALDRNTTAPINVHVYVDGKATAALHANKERADLAGYSVGTAHGFSGSVSASVGSHQVCVYAIARIVGSNPLLGCSTVTVTASNPPKGSVDSATSPSPGALTVSGWALDPDTTASIQVHLYVDGKYVRGMTAAATRNDVHTAYGLGAAHGYTFSQTGLTAGAHQVCVYAIDPQGGSNPSIGCKTVTVKANSAPIGRIDSASTTSSATQTVCRVAGTCTESSTASHETVIAGWALDPDTSASIAVHLYVDGVFHSGMTASGTRNDVATAYGLGAAHGFTFVLTDITDGPHTYCVWGIDSSGGTNPKLACAVA